MILGQAINSTRTTTLTVFPGVEIICCGDTERKDQVTPKYA